MDGFRGVGKAVKPKKILLKVHKCIHLWTTYFPTLTSGLIGIFARLIMATKSYA